MSKFITSCIYTAMCAFAASAAQAESVQFLHDGYSYKAEVTQLSGGVTRIEGHELVTGKSFRLYVKGVKVTGTYGSTKIAFAKPEGEVTQLSSR
jgi:hypothetical protein